jgi:hypothetical protein
VVSSTKEVAAGYSNGPISSLGNGSMSLETAWSGERLRGLFHIVDLSGGDGHDEAILI